jgi:hypothetical protein
MYFSKTAAYNKTAPNVPVEMVHTCSWITFLVKGDDVTTVAANEYKVTGLEIKGIDQTADVVCSAVTPADDKGTPDTSDDVPALPNVVWSNNTDNTENRTVTLASGLGFLTEDAINVETAAAYALADGGNVVVIPQTPGTLTLTYTYKSPAGVTITEVKEGISLEVDAVNNVWAAGKHYVYTLIIGANEILVAPSAAGWGDAIDKTVTVE